MGDTRAADQGYWRRSWRSLRSDRGALAAAGLLALLAALSAAAPLVSAYVTHTAPETIDLDRTYAPPGPAHWFGTDEFGRDYLTRIVWAGRISLSVGLVVAAVSLGIGVPVGLAAAYYGGLVDDSINAAVNLLVSIPSLFLLIFLASLYRPTLLLLAGFIGALGWMGTSRVVRSEALSLRQRDYVLAAQSLGASNWHVMRRYMLPNLAGLVIVLAAFDVAGGILAESGLSFLGLGIQPPTASWGNMLINSISYVNKDAWLVVFPGLFVSLAILSIYVLGDGLRDALDPTLAER